MVIFTKIILRWSKEVSTAHTSAGSASCSAYRTLGKVSLLSDGMNGKTYLMQNPEGKRYVKKLIDKDRLVIYQQLQMLIHPGLSEIVAIEEDGGNYFVIQEYIEGETLVARLDKQKISEADAIDFVCQLCLIVDKVHQRGIIHRDINPSNIIITPEGRLALIDFGIARTHKENQTQDTQFLGTPGYAAPEQFGFGQTSASSDIFALGVLFNVMLTGKKLNEAQVSNKDLAAIVQSCTTIDPSVRYQDVLQIDYDLRQLPAPVRTKKGNHQQQITPAPTFFARKTVKVAAVILSLCLVGFLVFILASANSGLFGDDYSVEDSSTTARELVGSWHNGSGSIISRPFGNSLTSDKVDFLDDATIILTDRHGDETTSIWQLSTEGTLLAEGNEFEIDIREDILIITDSRDRRRIWQRVE